MIVDLFSGPRGWSEGLRLAELDADFGIEIDADACATAYAAGHATWHADVADVEPRAFIGERVEGLIASPPCQAFSQAGKRHGTKDAKRIREHVIRCRDGWVDPGDGWQDPRATLVLQPLRWCSTLWPRWLALEQVPPVLPLWRSLELVLGDWGYQVWAGILDAADYGLPQHRERAFLVASLDHQPTKPAPSHGKTATSTRERWLTMAEGLGWAEDVDAPLLNTGRDWKPGGDRDSAQKIDSRAQPAPCLSAKAGGQWFFERPATTVQGDPRIWPPGHKVNGDDRRRLGVEVADERYGDRAGSRALRLSVEQALRLQGFRADYPVQGTLTSRFRQVGDAVPPPLAAAVLRQAAFSQKAL